MDENIIKLARGYHVIKYFCGSSPKSRPLIKHCFVINLVSYRKITSLSQIFALSKKTYFPITQLPIKPLIGYSNFIVQ